MASTPRAHETREATTLEPVQLAAILASARAFVKQPGKRSVLFIHHGSEERGLIGSRYHAAIAVLSVRNRISRRDVVELCEQLFGSRISSGTIDAILTRVADALSHQQEQAEANQGQSQDHVGRVHVTNP